MPGTDRTDSSVAAELPVAKPPLVPLRIAQIHAEHTYAT